MLSVQVLTRKQSASSIQQTSQHQLVVVSSVDDLTRAHHVSHDKTAKVFLFIISFGFVVVVVVLVSIIVSFIVSLCVCASVCVSRCSASSGFNEFQFILHLLLVVDFGVLLLILTVIRLQILIATEQI